MNQIPQACLLQLDGESESDYQERCRKIDNASKLSVYEQALHVIAMGRHQAACPTKFMPLNNCPYCPSPASIARDALK